MIHDNDFTASFNPDLEDFAPKYDFDPEMTDARPKIDIDFSIAANKQKEYLDSLRAIPESVSETRSSESDTSWLDAWEAEIESTKSDKGKIKSETEFPPQTPPWTLKPSGVDHNQILSISTSGDGKRPVLHDPLSSDLNTIRSRQIDLGNPPGICRGTPLEESDTPPANAGVPPIYVPKGTIPAIWAELSRQYQSGCPLDYIDSDGTVNHFESRPKDGKFHLKRAYEMLLIFLSRIFEYGLDYKSKNGWYEISAYYWENLDKRYPHYLKWLESHGYLIVDHSWSDGRIKSERYSKSYRWPDSVTEVEPYSVSDTFVIRKLGGSERKQYVTPPEFRKSVEKLRNKIGSFQIDIPKAIDLISSQEYETEAIKAVEVEKVKRLGDLGLIKESIRRVRPGRLYSRLTSIPRIIRKSNCISLNGEPIMELDIRCAQPSMLYANLSAWNPSEDDLKYFPSPTLVSLVQAKDAECKKLHFLLVTEKVGDIAKNKDTKDFYNYFRHVYWKKTGNELTREETKAKVYGLFFASKIYQLDKDLKDIVLKEFPIMFHFIFSKLKSEGIDLWALLQGYESSIILDHICERIMLEIPDMDFFTVHDSICFPKSYRAKVEIIWKEELRKNHVVQPGL